MPTSSQNTAPLSSTRAFIDLVAAIDRNVSSDRAVDLLANFRTAVRAELRAELLNEGTETAPHGFKNHSCVTVACAACGYEYDETEFTMHFPSAAEASNQAVSDGWDELKDGRILCMRGDEKHDELRNTVGIVDAYGEEALS